MPTTKTDTIQVNPADETNQVHMWVKAARSGNRESFECLAHKYYQAVFQMVYSRTQNRMDAEDITQDVFMKAFKGLGRLTDANLFRGWLFKIAVNRVRDFHRRKKFIGLFKSLSDDPDEMQPDQIESTGPGPHALLEQQCFHQESEKFLARLTKIEKDVFMLRFFDQLQLNEIAMALQRSKSTIKTHLYRAVAKFKNDRSFRKFLKGV